MAYESPIDIINEKVTETLDDGVMKAVYKAEFYVDKYELYRALQYDRGQYEKGYADRDHEIVRCKDCIHHQYYNCDMLYGFQDAFVVLDNDYCSKAERRKDNG